MRIIKYLVCLCYLGCNPSERHSIDKHTTNHTNSITPATKDSSQPTPAKPVAKSIDDLTGYNWSPNHPDHTGYLCEMKFRDEHAIIFFHAQCAYFFFTSTTYAKEHQQVRLIWTYKTDCLLDMSFLERSNGAKKYPRHGNTFAIYKLADDTTVRVEYMFPEWVQKVNQIAKDSLFPHNLYLRQ